MTYTKLIREIAEKHGNWHRPNFYIDEVERRTGHRVYHGTVISALGTHQSRAATTPAQLRAAASYLLDLCLGDRCLARWIVNTVADSIDAHAPPKAPHL